MLPHINSECSFINHSPTHCIFSFIHLNFSLSINFFLLKLPLCWVYCNRNIYWSSNWSFLVFLRDVRDQNQWMVPNRTLYFDVIWCSFKLSFALLYRSSFSFSSKMKLFLSSLKKFRISKLNNNYPELISSWQTNRLRSKLKLRSIHVSK